jgi:hypothetical protein
VKSGKRKAATTHLVQSSLKSFEHVIASGIPPNPENRSGPELTLHAAPSSVLCDDVLKSIIISAIMPQKPDDVL